MFISVQFLVNRLAFNFKNRGAGSTSVSHFIAISRPHQRLPDGVEELCESCFCDCKSLSCVRFGESFSLKLIGKEAFTSSGR